MPYCDACTFGFLLREAAGNAHFERRRRLEAIFLSAKGPQHALPPRDENIVGETLGDNQSGQMQPPRSSSDRVAYLVNYVLQNLFLLLNTPLP